MTFIKYRAFTYGVTATNARKRRPLVFQTNPVRVLLFSCVNDFFVLLKNLSHFYGKKKKQQKKKKKGQQLEIWLEKLYLICTKLSSQAWTLFHCMCSLEHVDTKLGFPLTALLFKPLQRIHQPEYAEMIKVVLTNAAPRKCYT